MRNAGRSANHTITLQSKQRTAQHWKRWDLYNAILIKTVAISSKILELLRRGSLSLRSEPVVARSVLYCFTTIEHDFAPIRPLPFQRKPRRLPIVVARLWSIWRRFCTQFVTQVSSASVMTSLFCCSAAFLCF
jgi:hypothetical protein